MSHRSRSLTNGRWTWVALVLVIAGLLATMALPAGAAETAPTDTQRSAAARAQSDRVIGRVVGLRGRVYAQSPGQVRRPLVENAPIYPGDRIVTSRGAQLGVLSGEYYTGLDERTTLVYRKLGRGAPEVRLERGDVRVINAGQGANAQLSTPGIHASSSGPDVAAYAVKEKAWMVSIVCAHEGQVRVSEQGGRRSLLVDEGGCAASKPVEGLYAAGGAGTPLPVASPALGSAADAAASGGPPVSPYSANGPLAGRAASRFGDPADVALGPGIGLALAGAGPGLAISDRRLDLIQPCDSPSSGCSGARVPTDPPTNPWIGGTLPPF